MSNRTRRMPSRILLGIYVILCAIFFVVPLLALAGFSLFIPTKGWTLQVYEQLLQTPEFWQSLTLSLVLAILTTICSLALMIPTMLWLNLRAHAHRRVVEAITLLTFAVPPITLAIGASAVILDIAPAALGSALILVPFYVVFAFAFTYRALDAGIQSIDLVTLVEASHSLGSRTSTVVWRVILPCLRTSILGAAFLTITVVLGEYVLASLFLYNTLPVFMAQVGTSQAQGAAGLALLMVLFTWFMLLGLNGVSRLMGSNGISSTVMKA